MDRNTFEVIIGKAIEREIEAREFYSALAGAVKTDYLRGLFTDLAQEEQGHRNTLELFLRDETRLLQFVAPAKDLKISEATEDPPLTLEMKPADAVALAMKKEQAAVEFYSSFAAGASDPETKNVFVKLAAMESNHKHRLENLFIEIGYPEAW